MVINAIDTISNRINELVNFFSNGNNSKFARLIDTSEANVRNYRSNTLPKADFLIKVAEKLEINCEWLLLGKGEMHTKSSANYNDCVKCYEKDRLIKAHEARIEEQSLIIKQLLNINVLQ